MPRDKHDDNPEWTAADFAKARHAAELPEHVSDAFPKLRGRPKAAETKQPVTIRLSRTVVDHYKATGAGWQGRMNKELEQLVFRKIAGRGAGRAGREMTVTAAQPAAKAKIGATRPASAAAKAAAGKPPKGKRT